jgi:hypothetical protein
LLNIGGDSNQTGRDFLLAVRLAVHQPLIVNQESRKSYCARDGYSGIAQTTMAQRNSESGLRLARTQYRGEEAVCAHFVC